MRGQELKLQSLELNLGRSASGGTVWLRQPSNPHVYISGRSGSGKSVFLKHLLRQALEQDTLCLVLDYSDDFSGYLPPPGIPARRLDIMYPAFTMNPLAHAGQDPEYCAQQLLSVLTQVFRLGPRASLALLQTTQAYLEAEADMPTLSGLCRYAADRTASGSGLASALEPLELLAYLVRCGDEPISLDLSMPGLCILDFNRVQGQQLRALLLEMVLQTIWSRRCTGEPSGKTAVPLIVVLDECQGLAWSEGSAAVRLLREGRKYDVGGWFCSQWIRNETAVSALQQAALQAHFRPEDTRVTRLARRLCPDTRSEAEQCRHLLQSLRVGQFLCLNQETVPVRISVPYERICE